MTRPRSSPEARIVVVPPGLVQRLRPWLRSHRWLSRTVAWEGGGPAPPRAAAATAAVLWGRDPAAMCTAVLDACPRLEWVHSLWTGLEHLPVPRLVERSITVTTGRGIAAGPLAEWALLAVLWNLKRVPEHVASWRQRRWHPLEIHELAGSRVVVVGLGSVGRRVARTLSALGAEVIGIRRAAAPTEGCAVVAPPERLAKECRGARALVVAAPLAEATRGMVGPKVLAALADGAVVVNVGRGPVIDETALLREVQRGRLQAALDVWWREPVERRSPWWSLAGVLPSPHAAYLTPAFRERHAARILANLERYLSGRRLISVTSRRALVEAAGG